MELNTLDLTRDEVVNVQGTSSFVHNLMCNLKIIRPGVWGLGGASLLPVQNNIHCFSAFSRNVSERSLDRWNLHGLHG